MRFGLAFLFFLTSCTSFGQVTNFVDGEDLPLWEAGFGVGGASFPDYPGSEDGRFLVLPIPSFIYRGRLLRSDEEGGIRGRLVRKDTYEVNLSFGGTLPVSSEDNDARTGMPDLPLLLEFGPSLLLKIVRPTANSRRQLNLNIPLRVATAFDWPNIREEGLIFNPFLFYTSENEFWKGSTLFTGIESFFSTRKYADFYYTVDESFVLPARPTYRANAGYGGTSLILAVSHLFSNNVSLFGGIYHSRFEGTANSDSPLLKRKHSNAFFLGLVWWKWQSKGKARN